MKNFMKSLLLITPIVAFITLSSATAYASSLSIQSLSPSNNVSVGTTVNFAVAASGFTNPNYVISDSFSGSTVTSSNISSSGSFAWTPAQADIGTHNLTIGVSDASGNNMSIQETLTITATPTLSIQNLSPSSTVNQGQTVSFTVLPSGFNNPSYSLADSFVGSTISSSFISQQGNFSWTPAIQDVGTHIITITVNDANGHNSSITETLVVSQVVNFAIQSLSPGNTVYPGQALSFNISNSGFNSPSYTLSDNFATSSSSLSNSAINSNGSFNWVPTIHDVGTHNITINVSDLSGHNVSSTVTIYVSSSGTLSITPPSPSASIAVGANVTFAANAFGFSGPSFKISDSFTGSSITSANMNSSGNFFWAPTANDVGSHTITISAIDGLGHNSIGNIQITVLPAGTSGTVAPAAQTGSSANLSQLSAQLSALQQQLSSTAAVVKYKFTKALKIGSASTEVTELQKRLKKDGLYSGPITGRFGALTMSAVKKFQKLHKLTQLGTVGPGTRAALNN